MVTKSLHGIKVVKFDIKLPPLVIYIQAHTQFMTKILAHYRACSVILSDGGLDIRTLSDRVG